MKPVVFAVGSIALDRFYFVPTLPGADEKAAILSVEERAGGPPLNVARALAGWQAAVQLVGCVGDDVAGSTILADVSRFGVGVDRVQRRSDMRTPVNPIIVDLAGQRSILIEPVDDRILASIGLDLAFGRHDTMTANLFHVDALRRLFTAARTAGARCVLDLELPEILRSGLDAAKAVATMADLVFLNRQVFDWWCENSGNKTSSERAFLDDMVDRSRSACLTLGQRGAVLRAGAEFFEIAPLRVISKNTNGAGDVFLAAMVKAQLDGHALPDAAQIAAVAAARLVEATEASWDEVVTTAKQRNV